MTQQLPSPNPRLQRTRAAVPLQAVRGESSPLGGVRRAPLSRKPLDGTRSGGCGVEASPSGAPQQDAVGGTRRIWAATLVPAVANQGVPSSNPSLHRTPAALLSLGHRGTRPAPVSSKPFGDQRAV